VCSASLPRGIRTGETRFLDFSSRNGKSVGLISHPRLGVTAAHANSESGVTRPMALPHESAGVPTWYPVRKHRLLRCHAL